LRNSSTKRIADTALFAADVPAERPAVPARDPEHRVRHQAMDAAADANFTAENQPVRARQKVGNGLARPSCAAGKIFERAHCRIKFSEQ
jgi:hypothetical protein